MASRRINVGSVGTLLCAARHGFQFSQKHERYVRISEEGSSLTFRVEVCPPDQMRTFLDEWCRGGSGRSGRTYYYPSSESERSQIYSSIPAPDAKGYHWFMIDEHATQISEVKATHCR